MTQKCLKFVKIMFSFKVTICNVCIVFSVKVAVSEVRAKRTEKLDLVGKR